MAKRIFKIVAIVLCSVVLVGSVAGLVWLTNAQKEFVKFDKTKLNNASPSVTLLDDDGQEIRDVISLDQSKHVPISALHDYTYLAFVAVEDKRFFAHNGIDYKRVLGATLHNLQSGGFKEGASTISQQLIKNTHLNNDKNIKRKLNEMFLARDLERNYTKEEILEMYLNTIYFGRRAYGIENAANVYFNKSAADLTVAESATLAGMIKAPNSYSPDKNVSKCQTRRNAVLKLMLEQQVISQEQYDEAMAQKVEYRPYVVAEETSFAKQVLEEACKLLNMTQQQLAYADFVIETYFDADIQQQLQELCAQDTTANLDGSLADLSCLVCNNDGGIVAAYFRGVTNARRQIGSTVKPIAVYTPALEENLISQASPVLDEPTDFGGYKPTNANGYNGWTTVKYAVAKSLNVPAVKTLNSLTLNTAQKYLERLGFEGEQNLSLALGNVAGGMNICELANCYSTLANGGTMQGVGYIKAIYSNEGEIYSRKPKNVQVYGEKATFLMTDMLQNAVQNGTAHALKNANICVAAKTGTVGNSDGNSDALVAGYTTQHTFVVWYSGNLPNGVNGATNPSKLACKLLQGVYAAQKPQKFAVPQGVEQLCVNTDQLYYNQLVEVAERGEMFWFDEANKPNSRCQFDYCLTTENIAGKVYLVLPKAEGQWKVFDEFGEIDNLCVKAGSYYAELWQNGKCVFTTPPLQVEVPNSDNFWQYWYWPSW